MHLAKRAVRQGYLVPAPDPVASGRQRLRLRLPFLSISLDPARQALGGASAAIQTCNPLPICNPLSRDLSFRQRTYAIALFNLGDLWNTVKCVVKCKNNYTLSLVLRGTVLYEGRESID